MTEVSTWANPVAVSARELTYREVADLDRLRAVLAATVDRTDAGAISVLWDSMVAAHGGHAAPAGFVEAVGTAIGDLLAVHIPGVRWSVWPGPTGPTLGLASDARPHSPVIPFLDAQDRWGARAQDWIIAYLTRAAAHLSGAAVPQPRVAADDRPAYETTAADFRGQAARLASRPVPSQQPPAPPLFPEDLPALPVPEVAALFMPEDTDPPFAPEVAAPLVVADVLPPVPAPPVAAAPAAPEPAAPAVQEDVAPAPIVPEHVAPAPEPDPDPAPPAPVVPAYVAEGRLDDFALDALDHAMALLRETGAFDREVFVLLVDAAGRRTESCTGDPREARFRASELVRSSGAARAAITWIEQDPVDLPGPRQQFPAVVVDAWDAGTEGIRVGRRFVADVLGTGPLGDRLVVGPIATLL